MGTRKNHHHKDTAIGAIADQESVTNSIRWLDDADFWIGPSWKDPDKLVVYDLREDGWNKGLAGWLLRFFFRVGGVGMSYFRTLDCGAKVVEGGPAIGERDECENYADAIKQCENAYLGRSEDGK